PPAPPAPPPTVAVAAQPTGGLTAAAPNAFQVVVAAKATGAADSLVAVKPVVPVALGNDGRVNFTLPNDTFAHTRADATVQLSAAQVNGQALPGWLAFNPKTGAFVGQPPAGMTGEVVVRVIARDQQGREAVAVVRINVAVGGGAAQPGQGQGPQGGEGRGQGPQGGEGRGQGQPGGEGQGQPPGGEGQPNGGPRQSGELAPDADVVPIRLGKAGFSEQLRAAARSTLAGRHAALLAAAQQITRLSS
ncbi:MAG: putative Ig domain-containing protein, partial [Alphaproteobacteria bacterium]|nr:putative Ig domain-containing protein [Alphaproteobacteria bacterium]